MPLGYVFLVLYYFLFCRQRSFFLLYLTCDICLRLRDCPVVLDVELP